MGWLPSAPQLQTNPLEVARRQGGRAGASCVCVDRSRRQLHMSCDDPDNPANFPRNMFVWRSNILGSSGKGHEYFLKYLLGTQNGVMSDEDDCIKPRGQGAPGRRRQAGPAGGAGLPHVTTCLYGDIVLPTATWYEKDDLNTSDMHPFIHPLSEAVQPLWQAKSDWEIYKGSPRNFRNRRDYLGVQQDWCSPR
jgi:nitrate reductase alpha subunit